MFWIIGADALRPTFGVVDLASSLKKKKPR
jgi:hypothetical protein